MRTRSFLRAAHKFPFPARDPERTRQAGGITFRLQKNQPLMHDYHLEYLKGPGRCGTALPEFEQFFGDLLPRSSVLDLGCGQGRDSVVAARFGHSVVAVDLAESGLEQLQERANAEQWAIRTICADIRTFTPDSQFGVVLMDRVLHMLGSADEVTELLNASSTWIHPGGWILIADTKSNRPIIRNHFKAEGWTPKVQRGNLLIAQKPGGPDSSAETG